MSASFEFLANFEDWRQQCREQPAKMDKCPFPSDRDSFERRIAHAELLKTLTPHEETAGPAKDGRKKKNVVEVGGFPQLVSGKKCGLAGWNGWEDWLLPDVSVLRCLPDGSSLIRLDVILQSPFFSRDDRSFYPADNVLKRHHVFLTPCLAASGLKGLLRWAWTMSGGSPEDAALIFGEAADAPGGDSRQGLLYCWPVYWNGTVGLEVINPQNRKTGAGTTPIKYEVVLPGSEGSIWLLLVNQNNSIPRLLLPFMRAVSYLMDHGGLSAKSSAGWGQIRCEKYRCAVRGLLSKAQKAERKAAEEKKACVLKQQQENRERWKDVLDASGELVPFDPALFTKKRLEQLGITPTKFKKTCKNDARAAYEYLREKGEWKTGCAAEPAAASIPEEPAASKPNQIEWCITVKDQKTFVSELEACVQELATWLK